MHQILVAAGWWTAISVCAISVWKGMFEVGERRNKASSNRLATNGRVSTPGKRSA